MEILEIKNSLKSICKTAKWRKILDLLEDGYKGMYVILRIVHDSNNDVVAGDLAKEMNVSTARIAYALNTLEGKGFIERKNEQSDRRKVVIKLTEKGENALKEREENISAVIKQTEANLTDEEFSTFFRLLSKMLQ